MFQSVEWVSQYQRHKVKPYKLNRKSPGHLLVQERYVLVPLLDALGGTLRKLTVHRDSWVDVFPFEARRITELHFGLIIRRNQCHPFSLKDVLNACSALETLFRLFIHASDDDWVLSEGRSRAEYLECVADHASQVRVLKLYDFNSNPCCSHVWTRLRLQCLEELTITLSWVKI